MFPIISAGMTGQATSQETGISVTVVSYPFIEIISPQNTTYEEGEYILLDYNSNEIETVWYNLDNETNETINTSFYFQASVGQHTLYLYGNQSNGTILSDSVIFTVSEAEEPRGGGGPREVIVEEEMIKEQIPFTLKQGETKEIKLLIRNDLNKESKIRIDDLNLGSLLTKISDIEFYLKPGEAREVTFTFYGDENKIPDFYIEKALIKTEDYEKEISFYIELESIGILFDVSVEIPEEPKIFAPGEELTAIVDFYNLGEQGEAEVNIEYLIKNEQGKTIFGEKQTLIISPSITINKKIKLPENIEDGDYIFYVKVVYDSKTAIASKAFKIGKKEIIDPLGTIERAIKQDEKEIVGAIAVFTLLYLVMSSLEQLFGGKAAFEIIKRVKKKPTFREYKKRIHKKVK
jgi:hypothetical protein